MNAPRAGARFADLWGTEAVNTGYAGHPGLVLEPRPTSLATMLTGVERWADRCFLVQGERRISFAQFLGALEPAAADLADRGVRAGDHILILAYNSPDWVLALWAAWRVGAVPVLGNRWWSTGEIDHALELTRPALVITDLPDAASHGITDAISPADLAHTFDATPAGSLGAVLTGFPKPDEDAPALVIFTSGSSGAPKGVVLSHRSVIANQHNLLSRSGRLPRDLAEAPPQPVTLVCTPLFHIGGVSNLITNLIIGGKLVLNAGKFDAGQVLKLIETERVQSFGGVPTMAIRVLEHPDFESHDLSSLRSWPLGGAPVPASLLDSMRRKLPQLERRGLGNTWGMSESGGFLTVAGNRDLAQRPGTVGRPYPVAELRIDDPDETGSGEILVRSPTVMLGYLGLDDGTVDAEGWLHTGDLGHIDGDGYLFLDGRSKDIVIRGGENIACAHVELALARHPDLTEVAVFGVPHPDLGEELAAVVVHRPGTAPTEEELRKHLTGTLAYFEIPTRWRIQAEKLPTLAGEKTDKKTLRATFADAEHRAERG
ncbi:AMP-dependent synthetase [Streptomyces sp. NWU339]|uniref:class I adenylate-forming enzyme family protein n=1 Tax=Streptomyces sp. NWU339 TaxID=2185284 RepID=UPI000D672500|nr:class I adenylate-forming enzyme family protein [Streptomyces sp. NWU339]PWI12124.1 AMP-dependent synthetase [Streptomyces sp. NWU339]